MTQRDRRYAEHFAALEREIRDTRIAHERRLSAIEGSAFLSRDEYQRAHANLVERINAMNSRIDTQQGRSMGLNAGWLIFVAGSAVLTSIIAVVLSVVFHQ